MRRLAKILKFTCRHIIMIIIPSVIQGKSIDNIFLGQLLKRCIIGFVTNKVFNSDSKYNPLNFEHF